MGSLRGVIRLQLLSWRSRLRCALDGCVDGKSPFASGTLVLMHNGSTRAAVLAAPPPTVTFPGLDSFGDRVLFAKVEDASGDGRPVRDSTARVYDIDEGEWTVEECAARPQARLGHALLALRDSEGQECVAALGGLRGRDDGITTTCDALQKRLKIKGSVPKGEAPKPHVHGCAVVLRNGAKAVVWTGRPLSKGDKDPPSNRVNA